MRAFRFDVEGAELSEAEVESFAHLVADLCHLPEEHRLALYLASVMVPQLSTTCDVVQRQALRMWRTGARLLGRVPDPGGGRDERAADC